MAITNGDYVAALRVVMAATLRPIVSFDYGCGPRYMRAPQHMVEVDNLLAPKCGEWVSFTNVREENYISPVGDGGFTDEYVMRMNATCRCGEYRDQDAATELTLRNYGEVEHAMSLAEKARL